MVTSPVRWTRSRSRWSVGSTELKPSRRGLLEDGELVGVEGQDLRFELGARVEAGPKRRKEGRDAGAHDW